MQNEFLNYQLAVKLKELGFDKDCFGGWDKVGKWYYHPYSYIVVDAPLWQQSFDFFREKYNLISWIYQSDDKKYHIAVLVEYRYLNGNVMFNTYEEARLSCIEKLIEIVQNNLKR